MIIHTHPNSRTQMYCLPMEISILVSRSINKSSLQGGNRLTIIKYKVVRFLGLLLRHHYKTWSNLDHLQEMSQNILKHNHTDDIRLAETKITTIMTTTTTMGIMKKMITIIVIMTEESQMFNQIQLEEIANQPRNLNTN